MPQRQRSQRTDPTIAWLLAGEAAIRWQTLRALRVLTWWGPERS
jgi:hypothetical protein